MTTAASAVTGSANASTAAAKRFYVTRLTSRGTPGSNMVEAKMNPRASTAVCEAFETHSVAPTLGERIHAQPGVGSAAQSGFYNLFYDGPVEAPPGTANGFGIEFVTSTGNADVCFVWEE